MPQGLQRHGFVAAGTLLLLMGPISVTEIVAAILAGFFLLRLPRTWRVCEGALRQPVFILALIWTLWQVTTLLWSPDVRLGLDEMADLRWALFILCLWPAIRYRRLLIAALAGSFVLGFLSQVLQWVGQDWSWVPWPRVPDRLSGWWDPAVGGTLLSGALGLHLPAAFMGRGRTRAIGLALSVLTLVAIIMTGTRGAWIAAAGLIVIVAAVALWTSRQRARLLLALAVMAVLVTIAGLALRGPIVSRVTNARDEITQAIEHKEFTTSTGTRIIMYWWAIEAFAEHPIGGVGAGGYHAWVDQHLIQQGIDPAERRVLDHAHCALLHVAATSGVVGLAVALAFIVFAFRGAFLYVGREQLGTYLAGPGFALIGLLLVSAFDTVHINTQSAALLGALLALAPGWLPREARP